MKIPIPIHDITNPYGIVILIVYSLSCFSLASQIHSRWLADKNIKFGVVYMCSLGFTCVWGLMFFNPADLISSSITVWIISIPVGLVAGCIAVLSDRNIIRCFSRRKLVQRNLSEKKSHFQGYQNRMEWGIQSRSRSFLIVDRRSKRGETILNKAHQNLQYLEKEQFNLWLLLMIAILEEVIFRGYLIRVCFWLQNSILIIAALIGTLFMFSLLHIRFGWPHVIAKLPLSALCLTSVVCMQSVLPAVIAHIIFNIKVWKDWNNETIDARAYSEPKYLAF